MKAMALDCEFNQPSHKLIEIGAVIFSPHTGELFDSFQLYVSPGEPINPDITTLTTITDNNVAGAPDAAQAYDLLKEFSAKHKPAMNPVVWGASTYNDSSMIFDQAMKVRDKKSMNREMNFMGFRVVDTKTLWQSYAMHHNKGLKAGLDKCVQSKLGIGWDDKFGPPHRALADAWNTARAWHHMMSKFGKL